MYNIDQAGWNESTATDDDGRAVRDEHGETIKVLSTRARADAGSFLDMAARIITEHRDARHYDGGAVARRAGSAMDCGRLIVWATHRRTAELTNGGAVSASDRLAVRVAAASNPHAAAVALMRRTGARLARVYRALARGDSPELAAASVGWNGGADSIRKAAGRVAPDGLATAWGEYQASAQLSAVGA